MSDKTFVSDPGALPPQPTMLGIQASEGSKTGMKLAPSSPMRPNTGELASDDPAFLAFKPPMPVVKRAVSSWGVLNCFRPPRKMNTIAGMDMTDMGVPKEATQTEKPLKELIYEHHLAADFDPEKGSISFENLTKSQSVSGIMNQALLFNIPRGPVPTEACIGTKNSTVSEQDHSETPSLTSFPPLCEEDYYDDGDIKSDEDVVFEVMNDLVVEVASDVDSDGGLLSAVLQEKAHTVNLGTNYLDNQLLPKVKSADIGLAAKDRNPFYSKVNMKVKSPRRIASDSDDQLLESLTKSVETTQSSADKIPILPDSTTDVSPNKTKDPMSMSLLLSQLDNHSNQSTVYEEFGFGDFGMKSIENQYLIKAKQADIGLAIKTTNPFHSKRNVKTPSPARFNKANENAFFGSSTKNQSNIPMISQTSPLDRGENEQSSAIHQDQDSAGPPADNASSSLTLSPENLTNFTDNDSKLVQELVSEGTNQEEIDFECLSPGIDVIENQLLAKVRNADIGLATKDSNPFYTKRNLKAPPRSRFATEKTRPSTPFVRKSCRKPIRSLSAGPKCGDSSDGTSSEDDIQQSEAVPDDKSEIIPAMITGKTKKMALRSRFATKPARPPTPFVQHPYRVPLRSTAQIEVVDDGLKQTGSVADSTEKLPGHVEDQKVDVSGYTKSIIQEVVSARDTVVEKNMEEVETDDTSNDDVSKDRLVEAIGDAMPNGEELEPLRHIFPIFLEPIVHEPLERCTVVEEDSDDEEDEFTMPAETRSMFESDWPPSTDSEFAAIFVRPPTPIPQIADIIEKSSYPISKNVVNKPGAQSSVDMNKSGHIVMNTFPEDSGVKLDDHSADGDEIDQMAKRMSLFYSSKGIAPPTAPRFAVKMETPSTTEDTKVPTETVSESTKIHGSLQFSHAEDDALVNKRMSMFYTNKSTAPSTAPETFVEVEAPKAVDSKEDEHTASSTITAAKVSTETVSESAKAYGKVQFSHAEDERIEQVSKRMSMLFVDNGVVPPVKKRNDEVTTAQLSALTAVGSSSDLPNRFGTTKVVAVPTTVVTERTSAAMELSPAKEDDIARVAEKFVDFYANIKMKPPTSLKSPARNLFGKPSLSTTTGSPNDKKPLAEDVKPAAGSDDVKKGGCVPITGPRSGPQVSPAKDDEIAKSELKMKEFYAKMNLEMPSGSKSAVKAPTSQPLNQSTSIDANKENLKTEQTVETSSVSTSLIEAQDSANDSWPPKDSGIRKSSEISPAKQDAISIAEKKLRDFYTENKLTPPPGLFPTEKVSCEAKKVEDNPLSPVKQTEALVRPNPEEPADSGPSPQPTEGPDVDMANKEMIRLFATVKYQGSRLPLAAKAVIRSASSAPIFHLDGPMTAMLIKEVIETALKNEKIATSAAANVKLHNTKPTAQAAQQHIAAKEHIMVDKTSATPPIAGDDTSNKQEDSMAAKRMAMFYCSSASKRPTRSAMASQKAAPAVSEKVAKKTVEMKERTAGTPSDIIPVNKSSPADKLKVSPAKEDEIAKTAKKMAEFYARNNLPLPNYIKVQMMGPVEQEPSNGPTIVGKTTVEEDRKEYAAQEVIEHNESKKIEPSAQSRFNTAKAVSPKTSTQKAVSPKPLSQKAVSPKPVHQKVVSPKTPSPKPLPLKAISAKSLFQKTVSPKPLTPKAVSTKSLTQNAVSPKPLTPNTVSPKPLPQKTVSPKPLTQKAVSPKPLTQKAVSPKPLSQNPGARRLLPNTSGAIQSYSSPQKKGSPNRHPIATKASENGSSASPPCRKLTTFVEPPRHQATKLQWQNNGKEQVARTPEKTGEHRPFRRAGTPRPKYEPQGYAICFSPTNPKPSEQPVIETVIEVVQPQVKPGDLSFLMNGLSSIFGRTLAKTSTGTWVEAPKPAPPLPQVPLDTALLKEALQELYNERKRCPRPSLSRVNVPLRSAMKSSGNNTILMENVPEYFDHSVTPCQSPRLLSPDKNSYSTDLRHPTKIHVNTEKTPWAVPKSPKLLTVPKKNITWPSDGSLVKKTQVFDDVVQSGGSGFRILEIVDSDSQTKRHPKYTPPSDN